MEGLIAKQILNKYFFSVNHVLSNVLGSEIWEEEKVLWKRLPILLPTGSSLELLKNLKIPPSIPTKIEKTVNSNQFNTFIGSMIFLLEFSVSVCHYFSGMLHFPCSMVPSRSTFFSTWTHSTRYNSIYPEWTPYTRVDELFLYGLPEKSQTG